MPVNKRWLLLLMSAFALTAGVAWAGPPLQGSKVLEHAAGQVRLARMQRPVNPRLIGHYRAPTPRWQSLMGAPRKHRPTKPSTRRRLSRWGAAGGRGYP